MSDEDDLEIEIDEVAPPPYRPLTVLIRLNFEPSTPHLDRCTRARRGPEIPRTFQHER